MLRSIKILFICLAAVSSNVVVAQSLFVRPDGFGPVQVGMSLSTLNKTLHTSYSKPSDPDEEACFYVNVPKQTGVVLMILNGRVARVDVNGNAIFTAEGIHVGDSEKRALEAYGKRLKVTPHAYVPKTGHYLTMFSIDRKYGIRFESEDGAITRYYAGTAEAISFIEGCE
jgi:hypothetical protein